MGWNSIIDSCVRDDPSWPKLKRPKGMKAENFEMFCSGYYDARRAYAEAIAESIGSGNPLVCPVHI